MKTRCFLHVPKCAGVSVHTALEGALPAGSISPKRQDGSLLADSIDVHLLPEAVRSRLAIGLDEVQGLADFPVVSGHYLLATLLQVAEAASIATVLREPRARILSQYAFWRFSTGVPELRYGHEWLGLAGRPLEDFLSDPAVAGATDNLVCRLLLAPHPRVPDTEFIDEDDVRELAGQAIAALDSLGFVGVIELAAPMWSGLSDFFGVRLQPAHANSTFEHRQQSATVGDPTFGNRTLELLARRTAVDAIIYRHAACNSGCSASEAEALASTAFARELIEFGNLSGSSADVMRRQAATIMDLSQRLTEEERNQAATSRRLAEEERSHAATQTELSITQQEVQRQAALLEVVLTSSSWRLTRPARVVGRSVGDMKRALGARRPPSA